MLLGLRLSGLVSGCVSLRGEYAGPRDRLHLNEVNTRATKPIGAQRRITLRNTQTGQGGVASGVPSPRPDHAHALAQFALDVVDHLATQPGDPDTVLQFRIGMNSGPVVAGVIGKKKFHYDIWGDMVNVASRMETYGVPGRVHVARGAYDLIKDDFDLSSRGSIEIKDKGAMETWFLDGSL